MLRQIELTIVSTVPPLFHLKCSTSGGPLAVNFAYWTRNGGDKLANNETFNLTSVIVDYINAVYDHTLTVTENFPGTYQFFAQDPFITDGARFVSDSLKVEGKINLAT